jgi:hypothetical protein
MPKQSKRQASRRKPKLHATRRLENDSRFLRRIESARKSIKAGRGVRIEDV